MGAGETRNQVFQLPPNHNQMNSNVFLSRSLNVLMNKAPGFGVKYIRFFEHHKVPAFRNHYEFAAGNFISTVFGNINCSARVEVTVRDQVVIFAEKDKGWYFNIL